MTRAIVVASALALAGTQAAMAAETPNTDAAQSAATLSTDAVLSGGTPSADAIRAAGDALIQNSGAPAEFSVVRDRALVRIKHAPSGLICSFPYTAQNSLKVTADAAGATVECVMRSAEMTETWRAASAPQQQSYTAQFEKWTVDLVAAANGARVLPGKQGVDALRALDGFARGLPTTARTGWIGSAPAAATQSLTYYAVADAGRWRMSYIASGRPDPLRVLAPMVWLTGLEQVGGRATLRSTRL